MAEVLISPGVLARENDQSQITAGPIQAGAALIGPTVKGQEDIPTLVTSYSEYQAAFGSTFLSGSNQYTFFTSISAYNYFQNGGSTLLVTRVTPGAFSQATSSLIATGSKGPTTGLSPFELATLAEGNIMNSVGPNGSNGTLASGSSDNFRWEITSPSTSSGVFSLLLRQGNDTQTSKQVVETYSNLSLDPLAPNYISKVIGDQVQTVRGTGTDVYLQSSGSYPNASRFIRVSAVNYQTPNYFNNAGVPKDIFTGSIPSAQSGSFGSAIGDITGSGTPSNFYQAINNTDSQGLVGTDYTTAINLLGNRDEFRYNVITAPGLILANGTTGAGWTSIQSNCENRGDAIFVGDLVNYDSSLTQVTSDKQLKLTLHM
jgi:hypothetical protein